MNEETSWELQGWFVRLLLFRSKGLHACWEQKRRGTRCLIIGLRSWLAWGCVDKRVSGISGQLGTVWAVWLAMAMTTVHCFDSLINQSIFCSASNTHKCMLP